jgi:anti-sigma regulatory factor (Ser/Thr protein kinase)
MNRRPTAGDRAGVVGEPSRAAASPSAGAFSHTALLYRDAGERRRAVTAFARAAAEAAAPLHAMVPTQQLPLLRADMPSPPPQLLLADMTVLGRNPARIIPAAHSLADGRPGGAVYCLWEPCWQGRSAAELREVARHEALCNLALRGRHLTVLCLYDAARAGAPAGDPRLTHPLVIDGGRRHASGAYLGPGCFPPGCDDPLPAPAPDADVLGFDTRLGPVREFARRHAVAAGLGPERASDFVLAVSEVASNTLGHTADGGAVRAWCSAGELLCQVEDSGYLTNPLAGSRRRPADSPGGHGLWLVNQVCDLVERRTGLAGTTTRLHMRAGS